MMTMKINNKSLLLASKMKKIMQASLLLVSSLSVVGYATSTEARAITVINNSSHDLALTVLTKTGYICYSYGDADNPFKSGQAVTYKPEGGCANYLLKIQLGSPWPLPYTYTTNCNGHLREDSYMVEITDKDPKMPSPSVKCKFTRLM